MKVKVGQLGCNFKDFPLVLVFSTLFSAGDEQHALGTALIHTVAVLWLGGDAQRAEALREAEQRADRTYELTDGNPRDFDRKQSNARMELDQLLREALRECRNCCWVCGHDEKEYYLNEYADQHDIWHDVTDYDMWIRHEDANVRAACPDGYEACTLGEWRESEGLVACVATDGTTVYQKDTIEIHGRGAGIVYVPREVIDAKRKVEKEEER